jgi:hypothetical protein
MKADPVSRKAIGIGIALGLVFSVALHNFALGILVGVAIGAALEVLRAAVASESGPQIGYCILPLDHCRRAIRSVVC